MKRHTLYTSICASALFLAGSLFFSACSDEDLLDSPSNVLTGEGIFFGTSVGNGQWTPDVIGRSVKEEKQKSIVIVGDDDFSITATVEDGIKMRNNELKPQSRGTQVSKASDVTAFDVVAYKNLNNAYTHYFTETVTDGVNPGEKRYWPSKGTVDFIATYPKDLFKSQFPTAEDYEDGFSFTYTIKDDVEEQEDIMVACPKGLNNGDSGEAVPLQFQHLLAAVQFKVGEMQFIKINSLKVTGVYGGDITFTYNNGVWTPTSSTTKEYDLTSIIADTSGLIEGDEITSNKNNSIMLVAPQTLPDGAKIVVEYTETITGISYLGDEAKTADLSGEWVAGKTTTYALNISGTDFGTVEIPRPDDQDAHYIMLPMSYKMGNILEQDKIKFVTASAQWKKDENGNDISGNTSSKTGISLKFESDLSPTQSQGYWTDKVYEKTITAKDDGTSTESPITGGSNIRGDSSLEIKNVNGVIVLFIEENNGTTNREGELIFTAELVSGAHIVLGKGSFVQLCPSWESGVGVERIENNNDIHPYGFNYNRIVTYSNPGNNWSILKVLGRLLYQWGAYSVVSDDEGQFITFNYKTATVLGFIDYDYLDNITLNYGALNSISSVANSTDGLVNTRLLYNFTGGNDLSQIETNLNNNLGWSKSSSSTEEPPSDYAAYIALSRNRMYELKTTTKASGQDDIITYKAVLYKDGTNGLTGNDVIEWYLPSAEEAKSLKETGTGENGSVITPLNGTYWSSTAGSDTDAYAHSFKYVTNKLDKTFGTNGVNTEQPRMDELKVRAVRKKPQ